MIGKKNRKKKEKDREIIAICKQIKLSLKILITTQMFFTSSFFFKYKKKRSVQEKQKVTKNSFGFKKKIFYLP